MTLRPAGQYDFASGTSVAAAELTGVIALLMSASPSAPRTRGHRRAAHGTRGARDASAPRRWT